ncbi:hypothetical protein FOFC_18399 [Fusarium oxysporum]|nr:hypothetical protein FOFC_18399 [Fusarium oxysporum]
MSMSRLTKSVLQKLTFPKGIPGKSPSAAFDAGSSQRRPQVRNHLHPFVLAAPELYHSRHLTAEVTCSDARVDPRDYFGLKFGEALVIRNAGGRAVDAFRSLEVMGSIAPIGLIVVVHHTDCGGMFTTEEEIRSKLSDRAPAHAASIKDKWFGTFRE